MATRVATDTMPTAVGTQLKWPWKRSGPEVSSSRSRDSRRAAPKPNRGVTEAEAA